MGLVGRDGPGLGRAVRRRALLLSLALSTAAAWTAPSSFLAANQPGRGRFSPLANRRPVPEAPGAIGAGGWTGMRRQRAAARSHAPVATRMVASIDQQAPARSAWAGDGMKLPQHDGLQTGVLPNGLR